MADQDAQHTSSPYALLTVFFTLVLAVLTIVFTKTPPLNASKPKEKEQPVAGTPLGREAVANAGKEIAKELGELKDAMKDNAVAVKSLAQAIQGMTTEVREWREEVRKQREEGSDRERGQMRSMADDLDFR